MKTFQQLFIFLGFLFSVLFANATLKVASVIGSDMVLQRNTDINIWGKADKGKSIKISNTWNKTIVTAVANENGDWLAKIKTVDAGGPYTINVKMGKENILLENILLGEVWLCSGQSNMEMPVLGFPYQPIIGTSDALLSADNSNIRLFTVKKAPMLTPQDTCSGKWQIANAESVGKFSAVGYFYARQLQQKLQVPVGVICSSVGGTPIEAWMSDGYLSKFPASKLRASKHSKEQDRASHLYNGMIKPITNFTIKGAIWYQGESNRFHYKEYAEMLNTMAANWRNDFGVGEFPFYYVQIAPYSYGENKGNLTALMREAQQKAMYLIPNSGMVCTLDLGNEFWIHPAEKNAVAKRLAAWSLSETYGIKGLQYKNPTFKSFEVKDSIVTISFNNAEYGITSFDKDVNCFELAGSDKIFYPAKISKMTNDLRKIQVICEKVKVPVAVRYGFSNFPKTEGYLFSTAGLPVPSFRSDNW